MNEFTNIDDFTILQIKDGKGIEFIQKPVHEDNYICPAQHICIDHEHVHILLDALKEYLGDE